MNLLIISGRITKDLEIKETKNGNKILPFDVAVQRDFKNKQTNEYDSDFISCLATGSRAEFLANHAAKGYFVQLTGRFQNNNYERQDGTMNYGQQMIVNQVDSPTLFLNKNENNSNVSQGQQRGNNNQQTGNAADDNPFANNNGSVDVNPDDLPF